MHLRYGADVPYLKIIIINHIKLIIKRNAMLKFSVNGRLGAKTLNLPTSIEEITEEYLNYVSHGVDVAPNYSLVALCHREKLSAFILAGRNAKKEFTTAVIPLFIKHGETDNKFILSLAPTNKLIISGSDLALGYHVSCPNNTLRMETLLAYVEGDRDAYQKANMTGKDVYFLEFKLVPNNTIVGFYNTLKDLEYDNPFKVDNNILGII